MTLVWDVNYLLLALVFLFVAALFGALVLAVCMAIDHYESGGRAERDREGI